MIKSSSISVKREIFFLSHWSIVCAVLHMSMLGHMPSSLSLMTECWIAFVFISHDVEIVMIGTTCTIIAFSFPSSWINCLIASMKCNHSISQTVPHISTMVSSWFFATDLILCLISSVMCGMTCTVFPRKSPLLSFLMTDRYI